MTRIQLLGAMNGLSDEAIHLQLASAIEFIIELGRSGPSRVITEIGRLQFENGRCSYVPIMSAELDNVTPDQHLIDRYLARCG